MLQKLSECAYSALMLGGATDNCLHKPLPVFLTLYTRPPFSFPKKLQLLRYVALFQNMEFKSSCAVAMLQVESFAALSKILPEKVSCLCCSKVLDHTVMRRLEHLRVCNIKPPYSRLPTSSLHFHWEPVSTKTGRSTLHVCQKKKIRN
jgi:hypothetical protein